MGDVIRMRPRKPEKPPRRPVVVPAWAPFVALVVVAVLIWLVRGQGG